MGRPERTIEQLLTEIHPRPWDWEWVGTNGSAGHFYLVDANKRKIGVLWGRAEEREAAADLIMTLVNGAKP